MNFEQKMAYFLDIETDDVRSYDNITHDAAIFDMNQNTEESDDYVGNCEKYMDDIWKEQNLLKGEAHARRCKY